MSPVTIRVTEICPTSRISREDGGRLRREIEKHGEHASVITVDFENLVIASLGFLDECLGVLALRYSLEELQGRIRVSNMREPDRATLNQLLRSRAAEQDRDADSTCRENDPLNAEAIRLSPK